MSETVLGSISAKYCMDCGLWNKLNVIDSTNYTVCMNNCYLSPIPYGCPPCPNRCRNPIKGPQCYCEEYDSVKDEWCKNNPEQYKKYINDVTYGKKI